MPDAIPVFDAADDAAAMHKALAQSGAIIVHDFLAKTALDAFNAELDQIIAAEAALERRFANPAIAEFFGDRVGHVAALAGKSPMFVEHLLCHPLYLATCDEFLGASCSDYQLNIAQVMERKPGCEAQISHRDAWVWKRMPPTVGEIQVASVLALNDFSFDNGATLVAPGSHLWEGDRYPEPAEMVAAEMPAGSAVIYLGNTFHGGGANVTTADIRRGIHVSYTLGWLRTEENQCLSTPLEVLSGMSRRAQELLGFGVHDDIAVGGGYLGTVELEAPCDALKTAPASQSSPSSESM
ncbi:MAG: phytanoyl-CoA dioxygenase family protein [Gammaproteobacteria bacterium]|nr:phytanoyl-CoA dioxygenase family protein [Gammaproteobacteria bacterium]